MLAPGLARGTQRHMTAKGKPGQPQRCPRPALTTKGHGGQGVEVVTGSHTAAEYVTYAAAAKDYGLAASRGSDFHSPLESHTELGTLPYLPGAVTPVWELLASRVQ